ncbi:hypothetical protein NHQ30_003691 [Ciborinia camelliae]|nr:hypothetical protein NHQ30_003691 [Ciborinia camelliae]
MEGLGDAIYAVDGIHSRIHAELQRSDNRVQNEKEAEESEAARKMVSNLWTLPSLSFAEAVSALDNAISFVQSAIFKLRATNNRPARRKKTRKCDVLSKSLGSNKVSVVEELPPDAEDFLKAISADDYEGFGAQAKDLDKMATDIGPIMDNFDEVLSKPYLDNHSAVLNTVPVLGLKDSNQIMYLSVQADGTKKNGIGQAWKPFGLLPDGLSVSDPSQVHFFPYKGNLYVSIGLAVWQKTHRAQGDPILKEANNDWSKMYVDNWTKIGDNVLPATNLLNVIPFATLETGGETVRFDLLILKNDGTIEVLHEDSIYPSNTWDTLSYNGEGNAPKWTRIAFWDEKVIALDEANSIWNLTVDFEQLKYSRSDSLTIPKVTDFTATDLGLVVTQEDNYVYRREVGNPPQGSTEPTIQWKKILHRDGVSRLGPASPGVMLDLNALTKALKSRYITAQQAVMGPINIVGACAESYEFHMEFVLEMQKEWADARGDEEKQEKALEAAWVELDQAIIWSDALSETLGDSEVDVAAMSQQLSLVKKDLNSQLTVLEDKLVGLKRTLEAQNEEMSKLKAAFWGAVAGALFGLALAIIGMYFGANPTILKLAGALFFAGISAAVALRAKITELAKAIADTESQIRVTEQAIEELNSIVTNFNNLDEMYKDMTGFWGLLNSTALRVEAFNDTILKKIGNKRFSSPAEIMAALEAIRKMLSGTNIYLEVLLKQGIPIPTNLVTASMSYADLQCSDSMSLLTISAAEFDFLHNQEVKKAIQLQAGRNFPGYRHGMHTAKVISMLTSMARRRERIQSEGWYDVHSLLVHSGMFTLPQWVTRAGSDKYDQLIDKTRGAASTTINCLQTISEICQKIQELLDKYEGDQEIFQVDDPLISEALDLCAMARTHATYANNGFVDINHIARDYQQELEREIGVFEDDIRKERAAADEEIERWQRSTPPPPPYWPYDGNTWRMSMIAGTQWRLALKIAEITNKNIAPRRAKQGSGAIFEGDSLTWQEMVENVSFSLGDISLSLQRIITWVTIDPVKMKALLDRKWDVIAKDTIAVLEILRAFQLSRITNIAAITSGPDHGHMVDVLSLSPAIIPRINGQPCEFTSVITMIDHLMCLPSISSLVGYWDASYSQESNVLEVLAEMRNGIAEIIALRTKGARVLKLMGSRQRFVVEEVVQGGMTLEEFVEYSIQSATPLQKAAKSAAAQWSVLFARFNDSLEATKTASGIVEKHLAEIDFDLEKLNSKQRTKTIKRVAEIIAVAFASANLFVSTKAGIQLSAALNRRVVPGWSLNQSSYSIRTILETLPLGQLSEVITKLTSLKPGLDRAVQDLEKLVPVLAKLGDASTRFETFSSEMIDGLIGLLDDGNMIRYMKLTEKDGLKIKQSWTEASSLTF